MFKAKTHQEICSGLKYKPLKDQLMTCVEFDMPLYAINILKDVRSKNSLNVDFLFKYSAILSLMVENIDQVKSFVWSKKFANSLLIASSMKDRPNFIEACIHMGADINFRGSVSGKCSIHFAAGYCCVKALMCLIKNGADVNVVDSNGSTPITVTSNIEIVDILMKNGADPSIKNLKGDTLLTTNDYLRAYLIQKYNVKMSEDEIIRVISTRSVESVKHLISNEIVDPHKPLRGHTLVHYVTLDNEDQEKTKYLLQYGQDV